MFNLILHSQVTFVSALKRYWKMNLEPWYHINRFLLGDPNFHFHHLVEPPLADAVATLTLNTMQDILEKALLLFYIL